MSLPLPSQLSYSSRLANVCFCQLHHRFRQPSTASDTNATINTSTHHRPDPASLVGPDAGPTASHAARPSPFPIGTPSGKSLTSYSSSSSHPFSFEKPTGGDGRNAPPVRFWRLTQRASRRWISGSVGRTISWSEMQSCAKSQRPERESSVQSPASCGSMKES